MKTFKIKVLVNFIADEHVPLEFEAERWFIDDGILTIPDPDPQSFAHLATFSKGEWICVYRVPDQQRPTLPSPAQESPEQATEESTHGA